MSDMGLFDEFGRCIPSGLKAPAHGKIRRWFTCVQPDIDYAAIHRRIDTHLNGGNALTAADFERRAEAILDKVKADPATANIANALRIPFFIPKAADIKSRDIGESLDKTYIKAVEHSFLADNPKQAFSDHNAKEGLTGRLKVTPGSRHDQLLDAVAKDTVVGYFFQCFSEYSVPAAVEKTQQLPAQFLLNGGIDTCAVMVGAPGLLQKKDGYPPLIWLAALTGERADAGYFFEAYGYNLTFNRKVHFDQAAEFWSSGLVVLG